MTSPQPPPIERRAVKGTARSLSVLSISVDPPAVAPPAADARTVALLRRSRERGVTTFDVAGARFPERAERLIASAFPTADPKLEVIVGRSIESLRAAPGSDREHTPDATILSALNDSLEQSRRRLAPAPVSILEWTSESGDRSDGAGGGAAPSLTGVNAPGLLWVVRLPPAASGLPSTTSRPPLFAGSLSILENKVALLFERPERDPAAGLIARDPFANGRLDGSRFPAGGMPGGPGERPLDLRQLHHEFDPILRLGFLTEGRRRTLAQAALRFVLGWPWVVTSVVPLPSPERFDEILGYGSTPPLSEGELTRLGFMI
jgi:aryl-alcohol dehydrogenase-like predicted oxidoreductase